MSINPSIFKAYDIRGTFPDQLSTQNAYQIGAALANYLKPRAIAVGRDMRVSSDALFEQLTRGLNDSGVDVIDLGLISTDGLYFAVGKYNYDGGVMITASHNPKEYNGFKICAKNAEPLSGSEGLSQMLKMIQDGSFLVESPNKGIVVRRDISDEYGAHALSFIDIAKIKPYHVVIDAGNGMAGKILDPVLKKLPIKVTRLFFELDGTFPNHPASPIELENLVDLQKKIAETHADFGVAFDGDADRMFLLDKDGRQLGGDITTALVSRSLLGKHKGETILYNLICSRAVPQLITKMGGIPIRTRVGHAIIKPLMKKHNAIFGGEHSGHFYFRDNWFADSGLIAFLVCLELISVEDRPLDQMVKDIDPYVRSGEINTRVDSIPDKIAAVTKAYASGEQDTIDGLTVQFPDWWFNLRPSNTEPLLRLNIEANTPSLLEQKKFELLKIIRG
jgi:phosphomannomutase